MVATILLQIIAVILNLYTAFTNNKKNILIATFAFNTFCLLIYALINNKASVISYILIVSRSTVYLFQNKLKQIRFSFLVPIGFILMHILFGINTYISIWNLIPIVAPSICCYLLWFEKSRQKMRLEQLMSDSLWLIYVIHSGLYILSISRIVSIISGFMAWTKNHVLSKNTQSL